MFALVKRLCLLVLEFTEWREDRHDVHIITLYEKAWCVRSPALQFTQRHKEFQHE